MRAKITHKNFFLVVVVCLSLLITACGNGQSWVNLFLMGGSIQGRALNSGGVVTTFAGTVNTSGSADGTGTAASFDRPYGITTDGTNLYVADRDNHIVRKIVIATAEVTTIAGSGGYGFDDGIGTAADIYEPTGITTDGTNLYVLTHAHSVKKIVIATAEVTTIAGSNAGISGSADGTGTAARFNRPYGITTDGTNLYIADRNNHTIRQVVIATGEVTTLAGTAGASGSTDGTGAVARFDEPRGLTVVGGNLYVTDWDNCIIRKIVIATGVVTTFAGSGTCNLVDGTGTAAQFSYPRGITSDGTNLYVADYWNEAIRKIVISTAAVTTLAGNRVNGSADGTGAAASFDMPNGITTDGTSLFVTDGDGDGGSNNLIRKID